MATLQQQAQALGDPTRHAIFVAVSEADRPVGVADLNERFDLHPNAIRQHLARLLEAGLVTEAKAPPAGRGRPRLVYEIDPGSSGRWGTDGPYEALSNLLAEIIATGSTPLEVGRRAADRLRVPSPSGDLVADVAAAMARQGFEPEVRRTDDGAEVVLRRCPFASTAITSRETVCAIHLGIAEGLVGDAGSVAELVALDPRTAGCRLHISLESGSDRDGHPEPALRFKGRAPVR